MTLPEVGELITWLNIKKDTARADRAVYESQGDSKRAMALEHQILAYNEMLRKLIGSLR